MATINTNLAGVTSGSQYASAGNNTIYTNLPFNTAGTTNTNVTFFVGASSSIDILYNQNFRVDSTTGFHELFGNIEVQGVSSDYTVSSWYGKVLLTHKTSGQVISFQLTKPQNAASNSGVNVEFLDGAIAFTSNVNGQGVWTVWATKGGTDTSTWGAGGLATQVPGTYSPGATPLDLSVASDVGYLNYSVNSSDVNNWSGAGTTYTLTTGIDTIPPAGVAPVNNTQIDGNGQTFSNGDQIDMGATTGNVLTVRDSTGASAAGVPFGVTVSGVQTFNLESSGTIGRAASPGTAQVDTVTVATSTGPTAQVNTYVFDSTPGAATNVVNYTYGGNAGSLVTGATALTEATAFVNSLNAVAGSSVATVVPAVTGQNAATATGSPTILVPSTAGLFVGALVTGTGIAVNSYIVSIIDATTFVVSQNATATGAIADLAYGGNSVTVTAPTAGTPTPSIAFTGGTAVDDYPLSSLTTANVAPQTVTVSYGSNSFTYNESGNTTVDAVTINAGLAGLVGGNATVARVGSTVTVTANNPGVALQPISIVGGVGNTGIPTVAITTPNGTTPVTAVTYDVSGFTGLETFNGTSVGGEALLVAATTDVVTKDSAQGTGAITINGGNDVSVTSLGQTTGTITVGNTAAPTGAISVSNTVASGVGGAIATTGGSSVTVTETTSNAVNTTVIQSAVIVTGGASTTAVTVNQRDAATAGASVVGVTNGTVAITDVNAATATADVITTVSLNGYGVASTVNSGALSTLNLAGTAGTLTVNGNVSGTNQTATAMTLNLNGVSAAAANGSDSSLTLGASAGTSSIATLNVVGSGAASTLTNLTAAGVTTLNVSGDKAVILANNTFAALSTVVSTNTAGVTLGTTALGAGVTFTGGDGADSIILSNTFTKAINMGGGDDRVTYGGAAGVGGSVNAGTGKNTIAMTAAQAVTASGTSTFNSTFTNFKVLDVTATTANATVNAAGINGVNEIVARGIGGGNTLTINGLTSGASLTLDTAAAAANSEYTLGVTNAGLGVTDIVNVKLSNSTNNAVTFGTVTAADVETINIATVDVGVAADAAATIDVLTLVATSATAVTVAGDNGLTLTNTGNVAITSFDASGVKAGTSADTAANLAVTFTSANTTAGATVTIIGGEGSDVLTGGVSKDTITGNAGNDTLNGGANQDTINVGVGHDYVITAAGESSTAAADVINGFTLVSSTVTNANFNTPATFLTSTASGANTSLAGLDLSVAAVVEANGAGAGQAAGTTYTVTNGILTLGGAGASNVNTLGGWLTEAAAVAATNGETIAFQFGGSTYVFAQDGANDVLLNLAGVTGATALVEITGGAYTAAAGTILMANI